ncbi:MAG TPA: hypothetical protein PKD27_03285, partial [Tepidiformaceae bacterium]|nr:hypothetical protein [Tepidiformaceae bacterium]
MQRNLALTLFACCIIVPALAACGGDSDNSGTPAATAGVTSTPTNVPLNPGTSPMLDAPASKYAIAVEDLFPIGGWITSLNSTYVLTMENYPTTRAFAS